LDWVIVITYCIRNETITDKNEGGDRCVGCGDRSLEGAAVTIPDDLSQINTASIANPLSDALDNPRVQSWIELSPALKDALVLGFVETIVIYDEADADLILRDTTPDWIRSAIEIDLEPLVSVL
jgi:hypothetical protein